MKKILLTVSVLTLLLTGCSNKEKEIIDVPNIKDEIIQNEEMTYDELMSGETGLEEDSEIEKVIIAEETLIIDKEKIINVLKQNAAIIENENGDACSVLNYLFENVLNENGDFIITQKLGEY